MGFKTFREEEMVMKKLLSVMAILLMAGVVAFPPAAHAIATLSLWDGVNAPIVITDQLAGDANLTPGAVTFIGAYGAWMLNVSTGITAPNIGGPLDAAMDLNSVNVTGPAGGWLQIQFSDDFFALPGANNQATMGIGGTTVGTVLYDAYYDNGNALFGTPLAGLVGPLGPYGPVAFGGSLTSPALTVNPFSLTQIVTITQQVAGTTSFNASFNVVPIPIPASALLLGSGLLGLLGLGRKLTK
jgi:hypothetical protein